jgi:hypothetical protein
MTDEALYALIDTIPMGPWQSERGRATFKRLMEELIDGEQLTPREARSFLQRAYLAAQSDVAGRAA